MIGAEGSSGSGLLGGPDLLVWIVLALGAAMVVGNLLAIFRPPPRPQEDDLATAPVARSIIDGRHRRAGGDLGPRQPGGLNAKTAGPVLGSGGLRWCGVSVGSLPSPAVRHVAAVPAVGVHAHGPVAVLDVGTGQVDVCW